MSTIVDTFFFFSTSTSRTSLLKVTQIFKKIPRRCRGLVNAKITPT